ncbi:regulator [Candidatus Vallotia cooleyia]|uniref:regulator n=1 Tax=Candidatus Vallotiella adelgis TaxID=1177211 RepID=UPI001D002C8A|nr:regulator [Candidatus Vallotia cooleyia]UDG82322.1 hypothetical protein GJV44_00583 [Candidatus Vallotia cooleyia]
MHVTHPILRLHLLLPFSLPDITHAKLVLHNLYKPALDKLVERATFVERVIGDDFQRTLPHERWVARCFGVGRADALAGPCQQINDVVPLAPYMLLADGGNPQDAVWACVEPVHMRVVHNHLVLVDPGMLQLSQNDAAGLLAVARPLIRGLGVKLEAPTPLRWYLSSEQLGLLASASPLRALGRNIDIWLPHEAYTGHRPRMWMKLQNEIQMAWFGHPINQAREARGLPAINSLWLYAQGRMTTVSKPFERVLSRAAATRGLAISSSAALETLPDTFDILRKQATTQAADHTLNNGMTLVELDQLSAPFIQQDWPRFRAMFSALGDDWFSPALVALKRRELVQLAITLCSDTGSTTLVIRALDIKKFWRRRSFSSLLR